MQQLRQQAAELVEEMEHHHAADMEAKDAMITDAEDVLLSKEDKIEELHITISQVCLKY